MILDDKYTYPGSGGVLVNLLGTRDPQRLDQALNDHASLAWAEIQAERPAGLDFDYLSSIHRRMFGSVLAWAGQIRDVDAQAVGANIPYARRSSFGLPLRSCSQGWRVRTSCAVLTAPHL